MFKNNVWKMVLVLFVISLLIGMAVPSYAANAGSKLRRGLANFATGWVEIPIAMDKATREPNPFIGVPVSFFTGLFKGIARTAVGVFDTVTFPIPPYEKAWLNPEFIGQPTK